MERLRLTHVEEKPIQVNTIKPLSPEDLEKMKIRIGLILQYKKDMNLIGLQISITYLTEESEELMNYQALFTVEDEDWLDFLATYPDNAKIREHSSQMFNIALGYARSSIARQLQNTSMSEMYLPLIKPEHFISHIGIKCID